MQALRLIRLIGIALSLLLAGDALYARPFGRPRERKAVEARERDRKPAEERKIDRSAESGGRREVAGNRDPAAGRREAVRGEGQAKLESTPTTAAGDFTPVRGTKGKENKVTGEVWEKDLLHKDHYEVYKNRRDYENGKRSRSVWEDGRLKEKF